MDLRGQTTVELLMILSVCIIAIGIVYVLYLQQIELASSYEEISISNGTVRRLVNAANTLYISGAGSKSRVWIDLSDALDMSGSFILGPVVSLHLSNGNDVFATADVNFFGDWKKDGDEYATGGYYADLFFDGNVVKIFYNNFELSNESFYVSLFPNSSSSNSFSVRNNSVYPANFLVVNNFSHNPYALVQIDSNDNSFLLLSGELKLVDFNVTVSADSVGNYAGVIEVIGAISDGEIDVNTTKQVFVSVESAKNIEQLVNYPSALVVSLFAGSFVDKNFFVCNTSSVDVSDVSWEVDGNASTLFFVPSISEISAGECELVDLNISVPVDATIGGYYSTLNAKYNGSADELSTQIFVEVH